MPSIYDVDTWSGAQEWSCTNEPGTLQDSDKKLKLANRLTKNDSVTRKYPNENNNKGVKSLAD